jgi:CRISPR-associated protein Csx16
MTTWFISRHPGAVQWASNQGLTGAKAIAHLDPACIQPGDTVAGTLPVHLAAQVCGRGARYLHLTMDLPESARGRELSAQELSGFGARLIRFEVVSNINEELA